MESKPHIPYAVIIAAKNAAPDAVCEILEHYDRLINHFSRRTMYDEYGNPHSVINTDIKDFIQSKVISSVIYEFDPYTPPDGETIEA